MSKDPRSVVLELEIIFGGRDEFVTSTITRKVSYMSGFALGTRGWSTNLHIKCRLLFCFKVGIGEFSVELGVCS